ncbi:type II secretion system protein [bacterium]|nr:type II secretion system protein [bacterium]
MRQRILNVAGFTLMELMVSITCIGILAAVALPTMEGYRIEARNAMAISNLRNLVTAQEAYFNDAARYSGSIAELEANGFRRNTDVVFNIDRTFIAPSADLVNTRYIARASHVKGAGNFATTPGSYGCYSIGKTYWGLASAVPRNITRMNPTVSMRVCGTL